VHIAPVLLILLLTACGVCRNEPVHTVRSPDGHLDAVVYYRHCGGPAAYSTHVSVVPANVALAAEPGNVLSVGGRHGFRVEWIEGGKLVVHGEARVVPERLLDTIGDVRVIYDTSATSALSRESARKALPEDFRRHSDRPDRWQ
jgi:hypothetical protein